MSFTPRLAGLLIRMSSSKKIWTLSCAWLDRYKYIHINHKAVYRHMGEMDSHGGISINIGYLSGTADEKSWPDQAA